MWQKLFYNYNYVIMPHVSMYKVVFFNIILNSATKCIVCC